MDFLTAGILCILLLLFLMALGIPIGLGFVLSGFIVSALLMGFGSSISLLGQTAYYSIAVPTWACIPLFMLMGSFASIGGFARLAYDGIYSITQKLPGSLAVTTCFSCALFGAMSGSSLATTAIFGKMTLPEMARYRYDKTLSVGCIASAGTFASMIPPSLMMIIYAMYTHQSVGKLFAAGVIPGLITAVVYALSIVYRVKKNPNLAPSYLEDVKHLTLKEKSIEIGKMWPVAVIATVVLGGIYSGVTTPNEAAATGAIITLIFGLLLGTMKKWKAVVGAMKESANATSMIFLIVIGAMFYSRIMAVTRLPNEITTFLLNWNVPPTVILAGVILIMFVLGMAMVPIGVYALTLPVLYPLVVKLGYDPIWFGVICLKMTEIGGITPPVGLNVFAMKGIIPPEQNISLEDIYKGIWPFLICDIVVLVILIIFPQLSIWLPNLLLD